MRSTFEGEPQGWTVLVELTTEQERIAFRNIGSQRFAYNWAVATIKQEYKKGGDERIWSPIKLRNRWYEERDDIAPWWAENSKEAYSSGIVNAVQALRNFQDGRTGERRDRPRFPKLKKKATAQPTFTATTGIHLRGNRGLVIPHVGMVRAKESLRRFRRAVDRGDMRITTLTLKYKVGKWYLSLKYRTKKMYVHHKRSGPESIVGVDLGTGKRLSTASDGKVVYRPGNLRQAVRLSQTANKRTKRREQGSTRWKKAKKDAAKSYWREGNIRKDLIHKTTSQLAKTHGTVVIEDLAVKAMARGWNKKSAAKSGMGEFRRQMQYKGDIVLIADRWYPSSKTCCECHLIYQELTLDEEFWECKGCKTLHQRDECASSNLAQLGAAWRDGKTDKVVLYERPSPLRATYISVKRKPVLKKDRILVASNDNRI